MVGSKMTHLRIWSTISIKEKFKIVKCIRFHVCSTRKCDDLKRFIVLFLHNLELSKIWLQNYWRTVNLVKGYNRIWWQNGTGHEINTPHKLSCSWWIVITSSGIMLRFIFGNILEVTFPNEKTTCNNRGGCKLAQKEPQFDWHVPAIDSYSWNM